MRNDTTPTTSTSTTTTTPPTLTNPRRRWLERAAAGAVAALAGFGRPAFGQPRPAAAAAAATAPAIGKLRLLTPGKPGSGLDEAARALGAALIATKRVAEVEIDNRPGLGGSIALARFTGALKDEPHALLLGDVATLGAAALRRADGDWSQLTPVARLLQEYRVLLVAAQSPHAQARPLLEAWGRQPGAFAVGGGPTGGVDHMLLGMMLRELGRSAGDLNYLPFAGGDEIAAALAQQRIQFGLAGVGEAKAALAGGTVRALAVSAPRAFEGLPSLIGAGLRVDMSNWFGVFGQPQAPAERVEPLRELVLRAVDTPPWKAALERHGWEPKLQHGAEFRQFVVNEARSTRAIVDLLGLKA
jgi:putative tricarboxylic transport membrane protein